MILQKHKYEVGKKQYSKTIVPCYYSVGENNGKAMVDLHKADNITHYSISIHHTDTKLVYQRYRLKLKSNREWPKNKEVNKKFRFSFKTPKSQFQQKLQGGKKKKLLPEP